MKHIYIFLLCVLASFTFYSCHNDDVTIEYPMPSEYGYLMDGGNISQIKLTCITKNEKEYGDNQNSKALSNYSEMRFWVEIVKVSQPLSSDVEARLAIAKLQEEYESKKSSFILEDYYRYMKDEYQTDKKYGWPDFFTAYTDGDVVISCDKTLFGELPGTNLSKYFKILAPDMGCLPIGIENPRLRCKFGDEIPTNMVVFFENETWLQPKYYLELESQPSEKYDNLTFYLSIPMIREHLWEYASAKYKGTGNVSNFSKADFKAQCLVNFNWK